MLKINGKHRNHPSIIAAYLILRRFVPPTAKRNLVHYSIPNPTSTHISCSAPSLWQPMGQIFEKNRNHLSIIAVYPMLRRFVSPKAKRMLVHHKVANSTPMHIRASALSIWQPMGLMSEKNEIHRNHPSIIAVYSILKRFMPPTAKRNLVQH